MVLVVAVTNTVRSLKATLETHMIEKVGDWLYLLLILPVEVKKIHIEVKEIKEKLSYLDDRVKDLEAELYVRWKD